LADGLGVNVQTGANPDQRETLLVEVDGVVDLVIVKPAAPDGHAVAVQVLGDGGAVDPEPRCQFVDRGPCPVLVYQFGDSGCREGWDGCPLSTDGTGLVTLSCFRQSSETFGPECPLGIAPQ
jgi:hypothetical protein